MERSSEQFMEISPERLLESQVDVGQMLKDGGINLGDKFTLAEKDGRSITGFLRGVGSDFITLDSGGARMTLINFSRIGSLRKEQAET